MLKKHQSESMSELEEKLLGAIADDEDDDVDDEDEDADEDDDDEEDFEE